MTLSEKLARTISQEFSLEVAPTDLLIDAPPPHREVEFNVDIYFPKEDAYHPLQKVSPVVDALARTQFDDYVKRVRLFAHPRISATLSDSERFHACLQQTLDALPADNG